MRCSFAPKVRAVTVAACRTQILTFQGGDAEAFLRLRAAYKALAPLCSQEATVLAVIGTWG